MTLAQAAKPMMISAQLGPLRGSCPRGHMRAIPGLLLALSHFGHEAMTVEIPCARIDERRGHAQSSKLYLNEFPWGLTPMASNRPTTGHAGLCHRSVGPGFVERVGQGNWPPILQMKWVPFLV